MTSMKRVQTLKLLWEKRFRGIYSPSHYALDGTGELTLATPRPLAPRSYDITSYALDSAAEPRWGLSVETLLKMNLSTRDIGIGMTSDDLYIFRPNSKTKFLADRHINYVDCSLSEDGSRLAALFSDLAGSSFALAYGDADARVIWMREFDAPVTSVAISRDGNRVLVGCESGSLTLLDAGRRDVWQFEMESAVRAVACSQDATSIAYADAAGRIGLITGDGTRLWEYSAGLEIVALALSADASVCAAVGTLPGDAQQLATLICISPDGSEGFRLETDRRVTGVAVSPEGEYLATGARDGTISVYAVSTGEVEASGRIEAAKQAALREQAAGNHSAACALLRQALDLSPADVATCELYLSIRDAWFEESLRLAQSAMQAGDLLLAITQLADIVAEEPLYVPAIELLKFARAERARLLVEQGLQQEDEGNIEAAEQSLTEAALVSPRENTDPRRVLGSFHARLAEVAEAGANTKLAAGDRDGALHLLSQAQARHANPERAKRISSLRIESEFEAGMEAYNARRYEEAIFQFKKTLTMAPGHSDAARYLEYARRFSQDSASDSLQDRFSRLE